MGKEILTFSDTEKNKFITIRVLFLKNMQIWKSVSIYSSGEKSYKYFIGYLYNDYKVKQLHIMLPKISAYVKSYD